MNATPGSPSERARAALSALWQDATTTPQHLEPLLDAMFALSDAAAFWVDGGEWVAVRATQRELAAAIDRTDRAVRAQLRALQVADLVRVLRTGGHQRGPTTYALRLG